MTTQFERILVPQDGSTLSQTALPHAISLAQKYEAEIVLYGCISLDDVIGSGVETSPANFSSTWSEKKEAVVKALEEALKSVEAEGIEGRFLWSSGRHTEQILKTCQDQSCHGIVMASHGRSGLRRLLLGSVAEGVVRRSTVPVLLIPCH